MKKNILLIIALVVVPVGLIIMKRKKALPQTRYTIGILQTASHPALDAVHEGFTTELVSLLGTDVSFITQNAQGSITQAQTAAAHLHADGKYSAFFTIATPALQALAAVEKDRPVIFAAVTDPEPLGVMNPTTNITGVTDMIDVPHFIETITKLLPLTKTVGIVYSTGELNSTEMVQKFKNELTTHQLQALEFGISHESESAAVLQKACRTADVIITPTDNMIASAISTIAAQAVAGKKPLIVSDSMLINKGPFAAQGVDYKKSGQQAARIAHKLLTQDLKPHQIPVESAHSTEVFVNTTTLETFGITLESITLPVTPV